MVRSAKSNSSRIKEMRGTGRGKDYVPWIKVSELSSAGRSTRVSGLKTGRVHHLLSDLETNYFFLLDWAVSVRDIREQYPLALEETMAIAERLGIKHPIQPGSANPAVMTTDFVVTLTNGSEIARSIKYSADLNNKRNVEKLEIERLYWKNHGVDWGIVTELEVPKTVAQNISWFRSAFTIDSLSISKLATIQKALSVRIQEETTLPLSNLTDQTDDKLGLEPGTSLLVVRHLLATGVWKVNLKEKINPSRPLTLQID